MAVTILEALQNAQFNLVEQIIPGISDVIGKEQLTNAVKLLNRGYLLDDEVETIIDKYDGIDNVPYKNH